jgi:NDP-sugar pyrophosphorylase family protein
MRAAILAGGAGTRLAPYTTVLPKPLVPVGERPILELIIRQLAAAGFNRVDLCVAHLGELIRSYLAESAAVPKDVELVYHWESEPLGTAGAIRELDRIDDEPLLVMNGDILTNLDYAELMRFHREHGGALSIATYQRDVKLQLGIVEGADTEVNGYVEKPTLHYEVSMGIYVYSREAIDAVPPRRFDFPDLVLALLADGKRVCKYEFRDRWYDIGTPGDLELAVDAYMTDPETFEPAEAAGA